MKKINIILIALLLVLNMTTVIFAGEGNPELSIDILSPEEVVSYPGHEDVVKVKITNHGQKDLNQVLAYVTMADLNKNMTVNLEDYNADKPVYIEKIKAGESVDIEIPIRFVYTSKYHLYVTVVTKENNIITSSKAITIEILGNTMINKPLAMGVAAGVPVVLVGWITIIFLARKKKYQGK